MTRHPTHDLLRRYPEPQPTRVDNPEHRARIEAHIRRIRSVPGWDVPDADEGPVARVVSVRQYGSAS